MDVESTSSLLAPVNTNSAEARPALVQDLALPAVLSLAVYASIPPAVQLDHGRLSLYYPLVVSAGLALFAIVGSIIYYTHVEPVTSGGKKVRSVALAFLLIAFVLRVALLL